MGNRDGKGISVLARLHKLTSAKTVSEPSVRIAVSGKEMNTSGSVLGQVLSNVQLSPGYIGIIRWNEAFRSYICDVLYWILILITSPTFSTFSISNISVACICNLDLLMLSRFSSLSTFSWLFQTFYMGVNNLFLSLIRGQKKRKQ